MRVNIWQKSHSYANLLTTCHNEVKAGELAIFKVPEELSNRIESLCPRECKEIPLGFREEGYTEV